MRSLPSVRHDASGSIYRCILAPIRSPSRANLRVMMPWWCRVRRRSCSPRSWATWRTAKASTSCPDSAELTTQQAAEVLNVSRPYLIKLLEAEQIPFRRVGTHRRVRFRDLRLYKSQDDLKRRQAADELTQLSQELGLY